MSKVLSKMKVPNVVEFKLNEKIIDNFALFFFDIERNQGNRFVVVSRTNRVKESNNYLTYQFRRLIKYARQGELEKFNYLARILLRKSKVFRNYAMDYVFPKKGQMNTIKLVNLYRKVTKLCLNESTELKYKRVWIDKKPGDAGRPLGVPTPEWRVYGHMLTRVLEVFLEGKGSLTRNQHGGKSGYGVMTFLKELAKRLKTNKYLIEFDIKGFFDHVTHESMLEIMRGCYLEEAFKKILKAKPEKYLLPSIKEDLAMQRLSYGTRLYLDNTVEREERIFKRKYTLEELEGMPVGSELIGEEVIVKTKAPLEYYTVTYTVQTSRLWELVEYCIKELERIKKPGYIYDIWVEPSDGSEVEPFVRKQFIQSYIDGMNNVPSWLQLTNPAAEGERELARDKWKHLDLENQGVPQGTSFGPLLASTVLGVALRDLKALIYMDDGVIMTSKAKIESTVFKLGMRLNNIGCELEPSKTRALGVVNLWSEGIKLLGTRWKLVKRGLFTYNVTSETRKGINKPLLDVNIKDLERILRRFYEAGLITPSKDSVMKRYLNLPRTRTLFTDSLLDLATRHQVFGALLARAYSPQSSVAEMAREINYGIFKAEAKLALYPFSSISSRLYRDNIVRYVNENKQTCTTQITLQNVSTLSNDIFLAYINKDLPVRSKLIYNFYPQKVRKAVVKRLVQGLTFKPRGK